MRWLHLTDVHVGRQDEAQKAALRNLVHAILQNSDEPYDAVLLTGDLAYSGLESEYTRFHELVLDPLAKHTLFARAKFISVPGNHDLDCQKALPCPWDSLDKDRQTKWFANDENGAPPPNVWVPRWS
jgi:3',5'-cyclic AMP phosphodiesterase CpdA